MDEFAGYAERINENLRHCTNIDQLKDDLRGVVHQLVARCNVLDLCPYEFVRTSGETSEKASEEEAWSGETSEETWPTSFTGQRFLMDVSPFVVYVASKDPGGVCGSGTVCTIDDDWYLLSCADVVAASNGTIIFFYEDGVSDKNQVTMTMDICGDIRAVSPDGQAVLVRCVGAQMLYLYEPV